MISILQRFGEATVSSKFTKGYITGIFSRVRKKVLRKVYHVKLNEKRS